MLPDKVLNSNEVFSVKEIYLPLVKKTTVVPSNAKKRIPRITAIIQQVVDETGEPNKKKKNINVRKMRFSQWDQL